MSLRAGLILVVLALVVGMRAGAWLAEKEVAERERRVVAEAPRVPAVTPSTLRCENGPEPRAWTRVEAEAKVHLVQVALDTALANSWNPRFRDWTEFAKANVELVKVCWGGEKP